MNLSLLSAPLAPAAVPSLAAAPDYGRAAGSFADAVAAAMGGVEGSQATAERMTSDLLLSGQGDVHSVALASQQAELSMELFQQVRNKFVQAYQEIMKMPM